jgi:hypothetical protein
MSAVQKNLSVSGPDALRDAYEQANAKLEALSKINWTSKNCAQAIFDKEVSALESVSKFLRPFANDVGGNQSAQCTLVAGKIKLVIPKLEAILKLGESFSSTSQPAKKQKTTYPLSEASNKKYNETIEKIKKYLIEIEPVVPKTAKSASPPLGSLASHVTVRKRTGSARLVSLAAGTSGVKALPPKASLTAVEANGAAVGSTQTHAALKGSAVAAGASNAAKPATEALVKRVQIVNRTGGVVIVEDYLKQESEATGHPCYSLRVKGRGVTRVVQAAKLIPFVFSQFSELVCESENNDLVKVSLTQLNKKVVYYIDLANACLGDKWYAIYDYFPKVPSEAEAKLALSEIPNSYECVASGYSRHGTVWVGHNAPRSNMARKAVLFWAPPGTERAMQMIGAKVTIYRGGYNANSIDRQIDFYSSGYATSSYVNGQEVTLLPAKSVEAPKPIPLREITWRASNSNTSIKDGDDDEEGEGTKKLF